MRVGRSFGIYFAVVFLGGALLAPWVYNAVHSLARSVPMRDLAAQQPFYRYVHRCWLALALIGLWPLLRQLGMRSGRDVGVVNPAGQWGRGVGGFAVGFAPLLALIIVELAAGARALNSHLTLGVVARQLGVAATTAVAVSVLEEILFRGVLFGGLRRAWPWPAALLVSSVVFALLHFFGKPEVTGRISPGTGLLILPRMLGGLMDGSELAPGLLNLTLVGIALGLAYQRSGTLYFSIGLHASWVFGIKFCGYLAPSRAGAGFWGTNRLTDGWSALIMLGAVLIFLQCCLWKRQTASGPA